MLARKEPPMRIRLILIALLLLPLPAIAQELVVKSNVNLREGPSSSTPAIRLLKPPERLVRTDSAPTGDYLEVVTEHLETGWVWKRNVELAAAPEAATAAMATEAAPNAAALLADNCPDGAPAKHEDVDFGETVFVHREGYVLEHSSDLKIPLWVCERVTAAELTGSAVRKNRFRPDPQLSGEPRSELADYSGSGYDRGHLAPAGNQRASQRLKDETFFLSNMAPQLGSFNRQVWRELETLARDWAEERGEAYIITGPVFYDPAEDDPATEDGFIEYFVIGDGVVAGATHFYKIVVADNASGELEAIGFVLEHRSHSSPYDFSTYIRSINRIEELTELDFMPGLGEGEAANIEGSASALWE